MASQGEAVQPAERPMPDGTMTAGPANGAPQLPAETRPSPIPLAPAADVRNSQQAAHPSSSRHGSRSQYHRRSSRYDPLYSLGRPLPTSDEIQEARRLRQSRSGQSRDGILGADSNDQFRGSRGGLTSSYGGGQPYILATPEMLEAVFERSLKRREADAARGQPMLTGTVQEGYPPLEEKDTRGRVITNPAPYQQRDEVGAFDDDGVAFPNPWVRFRRSIREPAAEALGTLFLVACGNGANCQVALSQITAVATSPKGDYLASSFGWASGILLGVYVAGGVSGGHLNPAVTLTLACYRDFPWRKVPFYVLGQVLGAWVGAVLVQALYTEAINLFEGGVGVRTTTGTTATGGLFYTEPLPYMSDVNSFFQEFFNTAFLLIVILAIGDRNNVPPPDGLSPFVLFWALFAISQCFGMQTAFATNPARDFGPRIMAACFHYGSGVWDFRSQFWIWCPWIATCSGGIFGGLIYDAFIYTGGESWLNKPWRSQVRFAGASKEKQPAGIDNVSLSA